MHLRMASQSASECGVGLSPVLQMNWFCFRGAERNLRCFLRRGFQLRTIAAAMSVLLWVGCNRKIAPSPALAIGFKATPQPTHVGPVTLEFTLADASSRPVSGAHLTTEADMTHAGMSPVFGSVQENQPGRYKSTLNLGMAGDWVILLRGTLPTGAKVERQFELRNVQSN
jgi:hypothetical protein